MQARNILPHANRIRQTIWSLILLASLLFHQTPALALPQPAPTPPTRSILVNALDGSTFILEVSR